MINLVPISYPSAKYYQIKKKDEKKTIKIMNIRFNRKIKINKIMRDKITE